jgi:hypothetical protein
MDFKRNKEKGGFQNKEYLNFISFFFLIKKEGLSIKFLVSKGVLKTGVFYFILKNLLEKKFFFFLSLYKYFFTLIKVS